MTEKDLHSSECCKITMFDAVRLNQARPKTRDAAFSIPKCFSASFIEDASDSDKKMNLVKSIADWNLSGKKSTEKHQPLRMHQTNINYSNHSQIPNQGRPRALQSQDLQEPKRQQAHSNQMNTKDFQARQNQIPNPNEYAKHEFHKSILPTTKS